MRDFTDCPHLETTRGVYRLGITRTDPDGQQRIIQAPGWEHEPSGRLERCTACAALRYLYGKRWFETADALLRHSIEE